VRDLRARATRWTSCAGSRRGGRRPADLGP
jgi:hypothetical protein